MQDDPDAIADGESLVQSRTMEIAVALLFLVVCAIVVSDSLRIGIAWQQDEGPTAGYFPFWIGVIMAVASIVNLVRALPRPAGVQGESFVSREQFGRVLAVLVPTALYIALIGGVSVGPVRVPGLGAYLASGLFVAGFMIFVGGTRHALKALVIGASLALVLLVLFEVIFLVPLPKNAVDERIVQWIGLTISPLFEAYVIPAGRGLLRVLGLI